MPRRANATMPVSERPLTEEQVARYHRDGYLAPIPALDPDQAARFLAAVEELEERVGGALEASRLVQPQLHYAWAYELATLPVILDAIESLLGPDFLVHSASIFSKGANSRDQVDWHQDGSYWDLSAPAVISAWVALTDSTPDNGCLRVVPGSHRQGLVPFTDHLNAPDRMLVSGLRTLDTIDEGAAVDVVLHPGEMSLHHVNTMHGSAPNTSATKRIGFAVRYVPPDVRQPNHDYEVLLARGRDDHHHYPTRSEPPTATIAEAVEDHIRYSKQAIRDWVESHRDDDGR